MVAFASLLFACLSVQVALADQGAGTQTASAAKAHAKSSKIQLARLRAQLAAQGADLQSLRSQVAQLQAGTGAPATPTGAAGGDLSGSYPNPQVANGAITSAKVNPANVDGAAATPSLRTLGGGAGQALAGDATAGGDLGGPFSNLQIGSGVVTAAEVNPLNVDGANGTASLRTLGSSAGQALAGNATAGGGLTGSYPSPTIAAGAVHGPSLTTRTLGFNTFTATDGSVTSNSYSCPNAGEVLLSGGQYLVTGSALSDVQVVESEPDPTDVSKWKVTVANNPSPMPTDVQVQVRLICLGA